MSCEEGETFIDDVGLQQSATCDDIFKTKECKCYATSDSNYPDEEQFCGFEQNGFIFPCQVGCCDEGCPGECPGIEPRPPHTIVKEELSVNNKDTLFRKIMATILIIVVALILTSTLSLFIKPKKILKGNA